MKTPQKAGHPDIRRRVGAFLRYLRQYEHIRVTTCGLAYSAADPEHPERDKSICITINYRNQS